jgi:membrane associated rhomboid family serine protease
VAADVATHDRSVKRYLPSPTLETFLLIAGVYCVQLGAAAIGVGPDLFVLRLPVVSRPWTLFTTVYAHAGPVHLLTNVIVMLPAGLFVERFTTRSGFHVLFFISGLLAAATVVFVGTALGLPVGALGASGGVFALVGYAVTGFPTDRGGTNRRSPDRSRDRRRPGRGSFMLIGVALVVVPVVLGTRPLVALGHATGFAIGLLVGVTQWVNTEAYRNRSLK